MSGFDDPLPPRVRAEFASLAQAGDLQDGPGQVLTGEAGAVAEGVRVRLQLRVLDGRITAARFRAYGCPWTLAVCNWLTGRLPGRTLAELAAEAPQDWARALEVPVERLTRLLVIEDALRAAAAHDQMEQGLGR